MFSLILFVFFSHNNAIAAPNKVEQIDSLIQKWLAIEQQRNAMINDWQQQEPLLKQRLVLLKQEQTQLEQKLTTANNIDSEVEEKRD